MKTLKQRFTQWFNTRVNRRGTLWENRYKSVLLEGRGDPLKIMALYVDLTPVREGLAKDPKNYRWCGYGEATSGSQIARKGLAIVFEKDGKSGDWRSVGRRYRELLSGADGAVVGSREFVDDVFEKFRDSYFKSKRKTGAREMRGGDWGEIYTARDLRKNPLKG